jgi:hypothetical protein
MSERARARHLSVTPFLASFTIYGTEAFALHLRCRREGAAGSREFRLRLRLALRCDKAENLIAEGWLSALVKSRKRESGGKVDSEHASRDLRTRGSPQ